MSNVINAAAEGVRAAARRLAKLAPSHKNPHKFHEDKSDLVHKLHGFADLLEGNIVPPDPEEAPEPIKPGPRFLSNGRVIQVDFRAPRAR